MHPSPFWKAKGLGMSSYELNIKEGALEEIDCPQALISMLVPIAQDLSLKHYSFESDL